jgi:hypothetical protein
MRCSCAESPQEHHINDFICTRTVIGAAPIAAPELQKSQQFGRPINVQIIPIGVTRELKETQESISELTLSDSEIGFSYQPNCSPMRRPVERM